MYRVMGEMEPLPEAGLNAAMTIDPSWLAEPV